METEQPKRKLVGWKPYLGNLAARILGRSARSICFWGGLVCFGLMVFTLALWSGHTDINAKEINNDVPYAVGAFLFGCLCLAGFGLATILHEKVEKLEPVELITRHNVGSLPEVEILVRGSEQPTVDAQAELLRMARNGEETPSEQLLRATQESSGNQ